MFFIRHAESDKINGKYVVGDPLTQLKLIKCLEMTKVVNGFSWKFVCKMGMGPRTNLYNIGGDPLTQLNNFNYIFLKFVLLQNNADSEKINGKYCVGDPLIHLCNQSNIPA